MRTILFLAILLGLAVLAPASAWHCTTWSTSTEGDLGPVIAAADHYAILYCYISQVNGCKYSILVYEETNEISGLQRRMGDPGRHVPWHDRAGHDRVLKAGAPARARVRSLFRNVEISFERARAPSFAGALERARARACPSPYGILK